MLQPRSGSSSSAGGAHTSPRSTNASSGSTSDIHVSRRFRSLVAVLVTTAAVLVTASSQSAAAAEAPPTIDGCVLSIPEPSSTDFAYSIYAAEAEALAPGTHDLTTWANDHYGEFNIVAITADSLGEKPNVVDSWMFVFPLQCASAVETDCEAVTFTDRTGWRTIRFTYVVDGAAATVDQVGPGRSVSVPVRPGQVDVQVDDVELGTTYATTVVVPPCASLRPTRAPSAGA